MGAPVAFAQCTLTLMRISLIKVITQCHPHGKSARQENNSSDFIQWSNGDIGDFLDLWGSNASKTRRNLLKPSSVGNNWPRNWRVEVTAAFSLKTDMTHLQVMCRRDTDPI